MRSPCSVVIVALLVPLTACVTREKHDATLKELDQARRAYAQANAEARSADRQARADLETLRARLVALEERMTQLQQELEVTRAQRDGHALELAEALKDRANLEVSIEKMKVALGEAAARELAASARVAEYLDLLARFKSLIDAGKLKVRIRDGRMVLELPTDILFASGSARLSEEGQRALAEVGTILAPMRRRFQVEGHTDDVPIRTEQFPSNWYLGSARALAVVDTLVAAGVEPRQISAATYGEHHPTASNENPEGRQKNRRIEVVLVPDLSLLPGAEELEKLAR